MGQQVAVERLARVASIRSSAFDRAERDRGLYDVLWELSYVLGQQSWTHGNQQFTCVFVFR